MPSTLFMFLSGSFILLNGEQNLTLLVSDQNKLMPRNNRCKDDGYTINGIGNEDNNANIIYNC